MFVRFIFFVSFVLLLMGLCAEEYTERDVVAMTILGEARGEGKSGMYAVATVINQRSINRNKTPKAVCLKAWQFSCWNKNDPNRKKLPTLLKTHPMRHYATTLAQNIMKLDRSYTKNADHYINKDSRKPSWLRDVKPVRVIGNHSFYKLRK